MPKKPTPAPEPPILMGLREYAEHRGALGLAGRTHKAVQNAIRDGRLVRSVRDGKIDPVIADQEWKAATLSERIPRTGPTSPGAMLATVLDDELPPGVPSLIESRARREAAEAALSEIELAEKRGELVLAKDVESKIVNVFAHCKTKLLAVPGRIRQSDPGLSDVQIDMVESAIRDALEELAGKKDGK